MPQYYLLIGNEVRAFAELSEQLNHYPMLEVTSAGCELKNVKPHWITIPDSIERPEIELMDARSEIRTVGNIENCIRTATRYTDWDDFDKIKMEMAQDNLQVTKALYHAQLLTTETFLKELSEMLRSAETVNRIGGPGSRKTVTDILDKLILETNQISTAIHTTLETS